MLYEIAVRDHAMQELDKDDSPDIEGLFSKQSIICMIVNEINYINENTDIEIMPNGKNIFSLFVTYAPKSERLVNMMEDLCIPEINIIIEMPKKLYPFAPHKVNVVYPYCDSYHGVLF
jgi:hypothetical protein